MSTLWTPRQRAPARWLLMAIEIRNYEGDIQHLSAFVVSRWRAIYAGRGIVPEWTPDYFRWTLPGLAVRRASEVIAAYDGNRLVGVLPMETTAIRLMGNKAIATQASWITVDPDYRRKGIGSIGRALVTRMKQFNEGVGALFTYGFINSDTMVGDGWRFWTPFAGSYVFDRPRLWGRVLDSDAVSSGVWSRVDRASALMLGFAAAPFGVGMRPAAIRPYSCAHLDTCFSLFVQHMGHFDFGYEWDRDRLGHHLGFGYPSRTLVLQSQDGVQGFVNFHILDLIGRSRIRAAIIDVLAPANLPWEQSAALLRAALGAMQEERVALAIILGPPTHRAAILLRCGFLPLLSSYKFGCLKMPRCPALDSVRRLYAHFR